MDKIIDIKCKNCGHDKSKVIILNGCVESGVCLACKRMTYSKTLDNWKPTQTLVHCPYCNSVDIKKISTASKVGSVALWGVFAAGKVSKQWHCNNCKSDF